MKYKPKFRSKEECDLVFHTMIEQYQALIEMGQTSEQAKKRTVDSYADFAWWVSYRGDFANDK